MNYMQYADGLGKVAESVGGVPIMLGPVSQNRIRRTWPIGFEIQTRHGLALNRPPDFGSLQRDSVAHNTLQHRIESSTFPAHGRLSKPSSTSLSVKGLRSKVKRCRLYWLSRLTRYSPG